MDDGGGGGNLVAWLALAVATAAFVWNVVESSRRRKTVVKVEVKHLAVPESIDGDALLALPAVGVDRVAAWPAPEGENLAYALAIIGVNAGDGTEYVQDIRVTDLHGIGAGANPGGLAKELPPRDRVVWVFRTDSFEGDLEDGFIATVVLTSSKTINSELTFLDDSLTDLIAAHNG